MRTIEAQEMMKQFDDVLASLQKSGPISIQSDGRDVAVVMSPALLAVLLQPPPEGINPKIATLFKKSLIDRAEVYAALRQYEADHPEG